jgi:hypothetical protein
MQTVWRPFFSYNLWSLFEPAIGQEQRHCPMKRGFLKARAKEPEIAPLIQQETTYQEIGLLAQQGIYEFHQDVHRLASDDGVHQVAVILGLEHRSQEVRDRVNQVLVNYQTNPVLLGKNILKLSRGDEGFPEPILLRSGNRECNLFAAIDCIIVEPDGALHIISLTAAKPTFTCWPPSIFTPTRRRSPLSTTWNRRPGQTQFEHQPCNCRYWRWIYSGSPNSIRTTCSDTSANRHRLKRYSRPILAISARLASSNPFVNLPFSGAS